MVAIEVVSALWAEAYIISFLSNSLTSQGPGPASLETNAWDLKVLVVLALQGGMRARTLVDFFSTNGASGWQGLSQLLFDVAALTCWPRHSVCTGLGGQERGAMGADDSEEAFLAWPQNVACDGAGKGHWKKATRAIVGDVIPNHLRPRALKMAIAPGEARVATEWKPSVWRLQGRIKDGVRWALAESSSEEEEAEGTFGGEDTGNGILLDVPEDGRKQTDVTRVNVERERLESEVLGCTELAAALMSILVQRRDLAASCTASNLRDWSGLLGDPQHRVSAQMQAHVLSIMASVCRHNPEAALGVSEMQWLPPYLNRVLASARQGQGREGLKGARRQRGAPCCCHAAGADACRMVAVLVSVCRVDICQFWGQSECSVLGLLLRKLLCPQQACQIAALRAMQTMFDWDNAASASACAEEWTEGGEESEDGPLRCAQETPLVLGYLLAMLSSTNSQELIQSVAECVRALLRGLPEFLRGTLSRLHHRQDAASTSMKSSHRRRTGHGARGRTGTGESPPKSTGPAGRDTQWGSQEGVEEEARGTQHPSLQGVSSPLDLSAHRAQAGLESVDLSRLSSDEEEQVCPGLGRADGDNLHRAPYNGTLEGVRSDRESRPHQGRLRRQPSRLTAALAASREEEARREAEAEETRQNFVQVPSTTTSNPRRLCHRMRARTHGFTSNAHLHGTVHAAAARG